MATDTKKDNRMEVIRRQFQLLEAHTRCEENVMSQPHPNDGNLYCNATFDGWGCWNYTLAGTTAFIPCPSYLPFNPDEFAHQDCDESGHWKIHPLKGSPWSNYTACRNRTQKHLHDLDVDDDIGYIYVFIVGFSLSILLLLISLAIFFSFRQLRCERLTLHKNLFISYLLTGISWILFHVFVTLDGNVIIDNPLWCQVMHVFAQYSTVSNFAWMFCEGLYLHTIMVQAFRTGKGLLISCFAIGWGVPLLLTIIYTSLRATISEHNNQCWIFDDGLLWTLYGPVVASVVVNICILINIIRLLVTKLRQIPEASQSKKAARATLILVPLFGLQYLIFPVRPSEDSPLNGFYHYFIALLTSLQGTLVSIMYCFCNGEVVAVLRRKWNQHRLMTGHGRKNLSSATMYTEAYSAVHSSKTDLSCQKSKVAPDMHNKQLDLVEMKPLNVEETNGIQLNCDL
ncbi:calcitonin receptor-like [Gigantopelta aegis]|uniref:calcitonin receptor-like n=1 Tax=Gigantopelta aegis TaxID=1735272 RepID=UPI001B8897E6|nr:calcitonin receptor-like [Gigantopelta aegis]